MAIALTESATFDSQVSVPQDGIDDETAASLVPAFQAVANRTRALKPVYDLSTTGASITPTGNVSIATPTTKTIGLNGTTFDSTADGGDLHPAGAIQGRHRVAFIDCSSTGTKAIPYYVEHVHPAGFGAPVTSGVVWQVGTPPSGSADRCWVMHLVNPNGGASIAVKDAGGTTLATLQSNTGLIRSCTIAYDGGAWNVIDLGWRP